MNSEEITQLSPRHTGQFRGSVAAPCPDCETRLPLQIVVAELLRKNQMLRMELQEARTRLSRVDRNLFGQEVY